MEYRLIHPYDMYELLDKQLPSTLVKLGASMNPAAKVTYAFADGIGEVGGMTIIDGITYVQTTFVPAITRRFS